MDAMFTDGWDESLPTGGGEECVSYSLQQPCKAGACIFEPGLVNQLVKQIVAHHHRACRCTGLFLEEADSVGNGDGSGNRGSL